MSSFTHVIYIVHSLYLFYLLIQGNVIVSTSSIPFQDVSRNFSQHSHLRLVYFTIFLCYNILSTQILYQAAVEKNSYVYNAVYIFLQTFKDSKSREKHSTTSHVYPYTSFVLQPLPVFFTSEQSTVKASLFANCVLPYITLRYIIAWGNFWMEKFCCRDPGTLSLL